MNVLMIGAGEPPPPFIQRQVDVLKQSGINVDFLSPVERPLWQSRLNQLGVHFRLTSIQVKQIQRADILHYQWPSNWLTLPTLGHTYHKKTVLSLRGRQINILPYMPGRERYRESLHRLLPRCDAYQAVSQAILTEAKTFGVAPERTKVIYTALDTEFYAPPLTKPESSPLKVVMVGGLIWRKGYEYALSAFRKVIDRDKSVELIIVGEGQEQERLDFTIQDLDLQNNVHLTGKLDPGAVRGLLQKSHIFLHTSLSEGIANSVIEAMACGLPVISTDCGGMSEAIQDGVEGNLVPTRDPYSTAEALWRLLKDSSLREQMGQAGRERVLKQFTMKKQAQEFKRFYGQLLS